MKKLQVSDREIISIAIQQEISRSEEARYDHRLHRVLLVSRGMSCYEVGDLLGYHSTTIQRWVRSFEKNGFAGLTDCERTGRRMRLDREDMAMVNNDLRKRPRDL